MDWPLSLLIISPSSIYHSDLSNLFVLFLKPSTECGAKAQSSRGSSKSHCMSFLDKNWVSLKLDGRIEWSLRSLLVWKIVRDFKYPIPHFTVRSSFWTTGQNPYLPTSTLISSVLLLLPFPPFWKRGHLVELHLPLYFLPFTFGLNSLAPPQLPFCTSNMYKIWTRMTKVFIKPQIRSNLNSYQ